MNKQIKTNKRANKQTNKHSGFYEKTEISKLIMLKQQGLCSHQWWCMQDFWSGTETDTLNWENFPQPLGTGSHTKLFPVSQYFTFIVENFR